MPLPVTDDIDPWAVSGSWYQWFVVPVVRGTSGSWLRVVARAVDSALVLDRILCGLIEKPSQIKRAYFTTSDKF